MLVLSAAAQDTAAAQDAATVISACGTPPGPLPLGTKRPLYIDTNGNLCSTASVASGTFSESTIATATLPTLSEGATVVPRSSRAGAQYLQLVFGSASGGGTQVDLTHGLPVNALNFPTGLTATGTALDINIASGGSVTQGSTTSGQSGSMIMGAVTTSAPSYTNAQTSPLSLMTDGFLRVDARFAGTASGGDTSIGSGGVAQNIFAAATPTHGWAVYNPDATEDLWVSDSTTAAANGQGSIRIAANGGGYETPPGYIGFHAVSVIGATTGHKVTARRW